ncbi:MAG TPA: protein-methionine-sulfoxide reductase heme-binding subunit MsrQ [Bacteroidota bacterium]|nr:protein-methionine-sulfoxide reductase heme-binding subunit MsrQ [Bacteroidota bacterium]
MTQTEWIRRIWKPLAFVLALLPFLLLAYQWYTDQLSANPIDDITDTTGTWTLRFLMITLAITPLRKITGWNWLLKFRRMVGLFAFSSVFLHFITYVYLDQFFLWEEIVADVQKRPFITVGFTSFLLMVPLALTSNDRITKWMGGKRWQRLHRLIYFIALGGVIHYLWLVKADTQRPLTYGAILLILLGSRAWFALRPRLKIRSESAGPQPE